MDFTLRPWQAADAASLAEYADDPRIAANLRDVFPSPYTPADADWFVRDCMEKEGRSQLCRAIVIGGRAVGCVAVTVGTDVYRRSAELGYWLGAPFWGQGVMTEAVQALCREAFRTFDLVRIHAEPFAANLGSRRVLEKAGFALEGVLHKSVCKNGVVQDSCLYALVREEADA